MQEQVIHNSSTVSGKQNMSRLPRNRPGSLQHVQWQCISFHFLCPRFAFYLFFHTFSAICGIAHRCVQVRRRVEVAGAWSSRGFVFGWLVAPSSPAARSRSAVRYILDLPQSSPSLPMERSTASPTPEYSTTVFQVHRGGSNLLSSFSSRRRRYALNPSRSVSSVCMSPLSLSDPPLAGTPRSGASDGSSLVCLHRESH